MQTVLLVILAVAFAGAGAAKLLGAGPTPANFERWAPQLPGTIQPTPFRLFVGVFELVVFGLAVAGIAGSAAATQLAALFALWTMIGAIIIHGLAKDPRQETLPAFVLLLVAAGLLASTV